MTNITTKSAIVRICVTEKFTKKKILSNNALAVFYTIKCFLVSIVH